MDVFAFIEEEHQRFRKAFKDYEALGDRAYKGKKELAEDIFADITAHERAEEEIFFPAIREGATKKGVDVLLESWEEHHVADLLIEELHGMDPEDERHDAKFTVFQENVEHHLDEEEEDLFEVARKALNEDEIEEIGEKMKARKQELMEKVEAS